VCSRGGLQILPQPRAAQVSRVGADDSQLRLAHEALVGCGLQRAQRRRSLRDHVLHDGVQARQVVGHVRQHVMGEHAGASAELADNKRAAPAAGGEPEAVEPVRDHRAKRGSHRDGKGGKVGGVRRLAKDDAGSRVVAPLWVVERVLHELAPRRTGDTLRTIDSTAALEVDFNAGWLAQIDARASAHCGLRLGAGDIEAGGKRNLRLGRDSKDRRASARSGTGSVVRA